MAAVLAGLSGSFTSFKSLPSTESPVDIVEARTHGTLLRRSSASLRDAKEPILVAALHQAEQTVRSLHHAPPIAHEAAPRHGEPAPVILADAKRVPQTTIVCQDK